MSEHGNERTRRQNPSSVISFDESMSRKSRRNVANDARVKVVILIRLSMNSIMMNEIFENTLNEEHDKLFLVKILFREKCIRLSMT